MFFEKIAEIIFVLKSAGGGNLFYLKFRITKQNFCFLKLYTNHIFGRRAAGAGFESTQKLHVRKAASPSDFI